MQDLKFEISDVVKISKYKKIFAKAYAPKLLMTNVISDFNGEEIKKNLNLKK